MTVKKINLALQGGGAHGAFTWGALDRLLEDERIEIEAITATSAGAMNAAALKAGWTEDGRQGAQQALRRFWLAVAGLTGPMADFLDHWLRLTSTPPGLSAAMIKNSPVLLGGEMLTRALSPYQLNPMGFHPLRACVDEMLAHCDMRTGRGQKLFIAATNVRTGRVRVFSDNEITTDAILASACLPTLFQAIEIDDPLSGRREAYWDGGYMGNPSLFPLFYKSSCRDILIVHINPIERDTLPFTSGEILDRINEISFNSSLMGELRTLDLVNRLLDEGILPEDRMTRNRIHSVGDDSFMTGLGSASKMMPSQVLILQLRDAGRAAMDVFLDEHFDAIGKRSSVDLNSMFRHAIL
ncbi:MAG: patatin-like phospholipase family protein [Qingshengfaniella sp.]